MRLTDIPGALIEDTVRRLRRWAVAGVVLLVCGVAALIETVAAVRLALEPVVGPVGARLILLAAFLLVAVTAAFFLLRPARRASVSHKAPGARHSEGDDRVAIIAEAIGLGYSLAQDFSKASRANGAYPSPPTSPEDVRAEELAPRA